jgi:hypothetical protein
VPINMDLITCLNIFIYNYNILLDITGLENWFMI